MKNWLLIALTALAVGACSSKTPPKPHGTAFPINTSVMQGDL